MFLSLFSCGNMQKREGGKLVCLLVFLDLLKAFCSVVAIKWRLVVKRCVYACLMSREHGLGTGAS